MIRLLLSSVVHTPRHFRKIRTNTTDVTEIIATVPLNNASKLRQRQRSMSSERGGDEGEGAEGMESLEEPLRQSKPSLRRESRQGTREH